MYSTRFLEAEDLANNFLFNVSLLTRLLAKLTTVVGQDLTPSYFRLITLLYPGSAWLISS